jgi:hypothetical protein
MAFKKLKRILQISILSYSIYLIAGLNVRTDPRLTYQEQVGHLNKNQQTASLQIKNEVKELEQILKNTERKKGKTNVGINIIVHEDLKRFFDDAYNPDDDTLWIEKVVETLKGFELYKKEDFNFTVKNVGVTDFPYQSAIIDSTSQEFLGEPWQLIKSHTMMGMAETVKEQYPKTDFTLFFLPSLNLGWLGPLSGGVANKIGGDCAILYLSWDDWHNKSTLSHEAGHLFGFEHPAKPAEKITDLELLLDPFGMIYKDNVMYQESYRFGYKITDEDKIKLEQSRKRFKQ